MNQYFLITWHESGDEIHFIVLPMTEFKYVSDNIKKLFDKTKLSHEDECKIVDSIRQKSIEHMFTQTYCNDNWIFQKYNIKMIIHLPELGY